MLTKTIACFLRTLNPPLLRFYDLQCHPVRHVLLALRLAVIRHRRLDFQKAAVIGVSTTRRNAWSGFAVRLYVLISVELVSRSRFPVIGIAFALLLPLCMRRCMLRQD